MNGRNDVEPLIRSEGTPEAAWRDWDLFSRLPDWTPAGLLDPAQRLVVVAPHPDDEVLAAGALLSAHARSRGAVLVVCVTDGEASHDRVDGWSKATLAQQRRAECDAALAALAPHGSTSTWRIGLPDGGVAAQADRLEAALHDCLRADDVVVTTWRCDGHPDHEATATACARVCADLRCRLFEAPVWMWHWATPGDPRVPWSRLRALRAAAPDVRRKQMALACHRSQLTPRVGTGPVVTPAMVARAGWPMEHFFT